ncbi:MAG: T9SS type A sorting domain-containing protein, partial [Bacteroidales bacterium]|nr:T9SS type A sorting domain-containing protein [Bacteroidales bacterium]
TIIISGDLADTIAEIQFPNNIGLSCSVNQNVLTISNNTAWNFPNFVRSYFNTDPTAYNNCNPVSTEDVIRNQVFEVYPNPFDKQTEINTNNREIIYYNLYDLKGNQLSISKDYKLKKQNNTYLFTNKKLKGGIYILSGVFADKGQFNIKLSINK